MITPHFKVEDFACHDGQAYPTGQVDDQDPQGRTWGETRLGPLCELLELIRTAAGDLPIAIDSGYRDVAYDRRLHDAHVAALAARGLPDDHLVAEPTSSEHPRGRAADIRHARLLPVALFNLVLKLFAAGKLPNLGGLGLYPTFVHVDVRPRSTATNHLAIWGGSRPSNVA